MKILIIEDVLDTARKIADALQGLGEITVCTQLPQNDQKPCFDWKMPSESDAIRLIQEADMVLLDSNLGRCGYDGRKLFPYCEGKKVIGISNKDDFGRTNFHGKEYLDLGHVVENLRNLVIQLNG